MNSDGNASNDAEAPPEVDDEEDDYTGFFLEPTANSINMVERIAEANRKLYEEIEEEKSDRPKKVQFSESLINFEPETYESEESEIDGEKSENGEGKLIEIPKREIEEIQEEEEEEEEEEITEEIKREPIAPEEVEEEEAKDVKVLLVMLPREQSSSCESVIGEEISGDAKPEPEPPVVELPKKEEPVGVAAKPVKARVQTPSPCKISKISLDLKCSPKITPRKRRVRIGLKSKKAKDGEKVPERPKSCVEGKQKDEEAVTKTVTDRRSCCIVRTDLPKYNGLRSEYGLSAEQLQERRRRTAELRQQRRANRMKKRQEELRRKMENEESFSQWLYSKRRGATLRRPTQVDTLSRSDVYIQTHAVYASRRGVFYSVEYGLQKRRRRTKKKPPSPKVSVLLDGNPEKSINLDRLFENVSPHINQTYRIYITGSGRKK